MATSQGTGTLPSVGPSSSQTSSGSQTESAARCSVFRGQKQKPHKDANLAKARSQSEYIQASNSVDFKYSARGSAVYISKSVANTVGQTAQATQIYSRNTAPYFHYLERKIKFLNSKVDSFNNDIEGKIKLIISKISSYVHHLDGKFQLVSNNKGALAVTEREIQRLKGEQDLYARDMDTKIKLLQGSHAYVVSQIEYMTDKRDSEMQDSEELIQMWKDFTQLDINELNRNITNVITQRDYWDQITNKDIEHLNAKKDAYAQDLDNQMKLLNAKRLHGDDLDRQIELQIARRDSSIRDINRKIQLLSTRLKSYARNLHRRLRLLNDKAATCIHDIGSQFELLTSKAAPFARELEGQLQLLDSKFTLCKQNVTKQQEQLYSNINSFSRDVVEKIRLLINVLTS